MFHFYEIKKKKKRKNQSSARGFLENETILRGCWSSKISLESEEELRSIILRALDLATPRLFNLRGNSLFQSLALLITYKLFLFFLLIL